MSLRACITGGTGCVGRNLIDELLSAGWEVTVLHRKSSDLSKLTGCDVTTIEVDLANIDSVRSALPEDLDAVFHVAANVSHWPAEKAEQWEDNVTATRNLARVSLEKGVKRFIFTSTGAVKLWYEGIESGYVNSKKHAEDEVLAAVAQGLDAVILRLPIVVGKYDYNNYSQFFKLLRKDRVSVSLPGLMAFAHAADVARGHILAFHNSKRGKKYLFNGDWATWRDVLTRMKRLSSARCLLLPMPAPALKLIAQIMLWMSSFTGRRPLLTPELVSLLNGKSVPLGTAVDQDLGEYDAQSIGYRSRSLDESLQDCYRWLVQEKLLCS